MTPQEAVQVVGPMLRHADLTPREVEAVAALRDHVRVDEPEHLTLSDGTRLRDRTVKSLSEGTRDDSARWTPDLVEDPT